MQPKTLFEYYNSQNKPLPTVQQRAPLAQQAGIQNYSGTAEQNTALLSYLMKSGNQAGMNSNNTQLTTIGSTPPVVSSKDNAQQFQQDSTKLDGINNGLTQPKVNTTTGQANETKVDVDKDTGEVIVTGDPVVDKLNEWEKAQEAKIKTDSASKKAEYESLYTTSLAAIDATTAATIDRINSTFAKRITEQERINAIDVARVKAYGLTEGGRFTPIAFQDAISGREQQAADKITALENERNSLIAQAKAARDEGASKLLREKLADLDKVDEKIRQQLSDVEKEADKQYQLLRTLRKEEEEKHQAKVAKITQQLTALAPQYIDEWDKMNEKQQDEFISKLMKQTGLDYATIYGIMRSASLSMFNETFDKKEKDLKLKKGEIDIEVSKSAIEENRAQAAAAYASAAKSRREGSTAPKVSKDEAVNTAKAYLDIKKGKDGKISPEDWNEARIAWKADGFSGEEFDDTFKNKYVNYSHYEDYGVKDRE